MNRILPYGLLALSIFATMVLAFMAPPVLT